MIVILDEKRRLRIPADFGAAEPGDNFEAFFDSEEDAIIFRRINKVSNWLQVLKECPISMDDIPPRRKEFAKRKKL